MPYLKNRCDFPARQVSQSWRPSLQSDVANCGGLTQARKIAALAEAYGIGLAPHNPNGPRRFIEWTRATSTAERPGVDWPP